MKLYALTLTGLIALSSATHDNKPPSHHWDDFSPACDYECGHNHWKTYSGRHSAKAAQLKAASNSVRAEQAASAQIGAALDTKASSVSGTKALENPIDDEPHGWCGTPSPNEPHDHIVVDPVQIEWDAMTQNQKNAMSADLFQAFQNGELKDIVADKEKMARSTELPSANEERTKLTASISHALINANKVWELKHGNLGLTEEQQDMFEEWKKEMVEKVAEMVFESHKGH